MDPAVRATFLASLARCRASEGFFADFYQRFIESSDEVRAKFAHTDMQKQVRMLEDSLLVVAVAVQGEEGSPARGDLPRIAARHSRKDLDIRPELYELFLDRLIDTVRVHDTRFTSAIEAAWRQTMGFGIEYMRSRH